METTENKRGFLQTKRYEDCMELELSREGKQYVVRAMWALFGRLRSKLSAANGPCRPPLNADAIVQAVAFGMTCVYRFNQEDVNDMVEYPLLVQEEAAIRDIARGCAAELHPGTDRALKELKSQINIFYIDAACRDVVREFPDDAEKALDTWFELVTRCCLSSADISRYRSSVVRCSTDRYKHLKPFPEGELLSRDVQFAFLQNVDFFVQGTAGFDFACSSKIARNKHAAMRIMIVQQALKMMFNKHESNAYTDLCCGVIREGLDCWVDFNTVHYTELRQSDETIVTKYFKNSDEDTPLISRILGILWEHTFLHVGTVPVFMDTVRTTPSRAVENTPATVAKYLADNLPEEWVIHEDYIKTLDGISWDEFRNSYDHYSKLVLPGRSETRLQDDCGKIHREEPT